MQEILIAEIEEYWQAYLNDKKFFEKIIPHSIPDFILFEICNFYLTKFKLNELFF